MINIIRYSIDFYAKFVFSFASGSCFSLVLELKRFHEIINTMVSQLQHAALQVELAKLKAIGKRNLVQQESERKSQKKQEMEERMNERRAEITRYRVELASLKRIETEQLALIERLQGN